MDWVLIIFGTQVIKKKRPVRPMFPDYLSVSYDYAFIVFRSSISFPTYYLFIYYSLWESLVKPDEATKSRKSTTTTLNLLTAKIFSLKQKTNPILSAALEKTKYCLFKKTVYGFFKKQIPHLPFREMWIFILGYSEIFKYKHTYSQVYSESSVIPIY